MASDHDIDEILDYRLRHRSEGCHACPGGPCEGAAACCRRLDPGREVARPGAIDDLMRTLNEARLPPSFVSDTGTDLKSDRRGHRPAPERVAHQRVQQRRRTSALTGSRTVETSVVPGRILSHLVPRQPFPVSLIPNARESCPASGLCGYHPSWSSFLRFDTVREWSTGSRTSKDGAYAVLWMRIYASAREHEGSYGFDRATC